MKRIWIFGLAMVFSLSLTLTFSLAEARTLADIMKAGEIVIGVSGTLPPWSMVDAQGKNVGWEIDLCHKLAEYLFGDPNKVKFKNVSGGTRIPFLLSEKIDIIWSVMGYTPERAKKVKYSTPYFSCGNQLMVKKGSPIKEIEDLKGKVVVVIKGTLPAQYLAKMVPGAKQIKFEKLSEVLQAFRDDRGEAIFYTNLLLATLAHDNPEWEVVGRLSAPEWWGVGFRYGEKDIEAFVNLAIKHMYETGFLEERLAYWWKEQKLEHIKTIVKDIFTKGTSVYLETK